MNSSSKSSGSSASGSRAKLDRFKTEVANSMGVDLENGADSLTTREAGSVGGEMVKRMIEYAERSMN
ncbi:MAG: alpha/beta-type small acid-soluble spore protein [Clostridia bacterium]|nr:alpha/beta-type small acid-soluble spore protein [Clostridia bacterium]MBQ2517947.1 alpha/beta-type small acid-soluble spore protein [Clostridia bacterium]MBQ4341732.1 alpha/beta-type small acid-soluble spore protein [Clostridia bacterium]MBR6428999.1 alpha/beta-type small acid-soluble spore protein [Clostridia bacterium]